MKLGQLVGWFIVVKEEGTIIWVYCFTSCSKHDKVGFGSIHSHFISSEPNRYLLQFAVFMYPVSSNGAWVH